MYCQCKLVLPWHPIRTHFTILPFYTIHFKIHVQEWDDGEKQRTLIIVSVELVTLMVHLF